MKKSHAMKGIEHHPPGLEDEGVTTKRQHLLYVGEADSSRALICNIKRIHVQYTESARADLMFCGEF